jgi:hypothetical protein
MPKMDIPRRGGGAQSKQSAPVSRRAKNDDGENENDGESVTLIPLEATHVKFRRFSKYEGEGTDEAHIFHKPIIVHTALIAEVNPARAWDHTEDGIEMQGIPTCKISFVDGRPEIAVLGDMDFVDYALAVAKRDGNFDANYILYVKGELDLRDSEAETSPELSDREVNRAAPSRDDDDAPINTAQRSGGTTRPSATQNAE